MAAAWLLAGCAAMMGPDPRDPFEPVNRKVLEFNEGVDAIILKPSATFYREKVPALVRTGVSNFFGNLSDGWSAVNSLLQLKFQNAAENWMRLNVNTFFGLGGILDIASELNIERHREDLGQTLGHWGVPAGPFVMLPLLGPSTLRDSLAFSLDSQGDPVRWIDPTGTRTALYALRAVDVRANLLRVTNVLEGAALDKYSFIRDSHLQRRRAQNLDSRGRGDNPDDGSEADNSADGSPDSDAVPAPGLAPAPAAPAR